MKQLEVRNLNKTFYSAGKEQHVVRDVSFALEKGEFLGLVGESGCGKSTIAKLLVGLIRPDSGQIFLDGEELRCPYPKAVYRKIQMVFQMPRESLDPRVRIGKCLKGILTNFGASRAEAESSAVDLLERVGLDKSYMDKLPGEMSGGECQRAAIARALAARPEILICDEVTSALDVSVQAQITDLLLSLKEEGKVSMLFISHDLALVQGICDNLLVMRGGAFEETGSCREILSAPSSAYTQMLIDSVFEVRDVGQT